MFAPAFHPAMKYAVKPRREIGIRTVFNILGPMTNPASANAQLLGVYDAKLVTPMACTLKELECEEAIVVHGMDGLDEISTLGKTSIACRITSYNVCYTKLLRVVISSSFNQAIDVLPNVEISSNPSIP